MGGRWFLPLVLAGAGCGEAALSITDGGVGSDLGSAEDASVDAAPRAPADAAPPLDAALGPDATVAGGDAAPAPDAALAPDAAGPEDGGLPIGPQCFADIFDPAAAGPNYDQFSPRVAAHCFGTNHQDIQGVERVVFLGDSVTVGTPPTPHDAYYRSQLADRLAQRFNLDPPSDLWKRASLINGTAAVMTSGDFASCAKWGARTDDLLVDGTQLVDCFPESERHKRTLVIMTIGGNDIAAITKDGAPSGGRSVAEVEQMTQDFVSKLRDAVLWLKDRQRFPAGVDLIFSNMFEFTDATGDVSSCAAAGLAGFDEPWPNQHDLERLVIWANEEYMRIAVETGSDLIWMLEHFCGHGFHNDDPAGRCYRGPNTERWFDLSCIHPNPTGHGVVTEMFMAVVEE
jgi:lysophospholipase L1-like esterase